jgi:Caspase domain
MPVRLISCLFVALAGLLIGGQDAPAQSRLALVIGINDYQNVFSLQKAVGDAKAIQGALQSVGFQVSTLFNGSRRSFNAAVSAFSARIQPGDIVLVHYSGHGVQLDGENFLLPADVPSPAAVDKEFLKSEAIALSVMIDRIKSAGARTAVFIIDACRNNPYAAATTRGVGGTRGLAAVAPPKGTFVMYSAGQGQSALDRLSDDDREPTSVYTRTLRAKMLVEGLAITDLARVVRDEVEAAAGRVNHEQRPAYYDELSGSPFYFVPPTGQPAARSQPTADPCRAAADHWRSAEAIGTIAAFEDHLARFPNCTFAGLARARLESAKQKLAVVSPPPPVSSPADRNSGDSRLTAPTSKAAATLVPDTIPFITDRDRNSIRADYLPAQDHKALAISVSVARFMTGQKDVESAKRSALENCQRAQDALNTAFKCELYAVGDVVVFTRGTPPMPPKPWISRQPSIERPFVANDIPLISDGARAWLEKNYASRNKPKAVAIGGSSYGWAARGQTVEEVVRRALEICGNSAGIPCMVVAIDDVFVVPVPTQMKPIGVFRPDSNSAIVPEKRNDVASRLRSGNGGWNAVAVGANGRPGLMLKAADEAHAIDGALADCRRQDRDCRVIGLGPFEVAPK